MTRMRGMYGPDVTFLGVDRCEPEDAASFEGADVVIIGAPYDAGASYRAGARFGCRLATGLLAPTARSPRSRGYS